MGEKKDTREHLFSNLRCVYMTDEKKGLSMYLSVITSPQEKTRQLSATHMPTYVKLDEIKLILLRKFPKRSIKIHHILPVK